MQHPVKSQFFEESVVAPAPSAVRYIPTHVGAQDVAASFIVASPADSVYSGRSNRFHPFKRSQNSGFGQLLPVMSVEDQLRQAANRALPQRPAEHGW